MKRRKRENGKTRTQGNSRCDQRQTGGNQSKMREHSQLPACYYLSVLSLFSPSPLPSRALKFEVLTDFPSNHTQSIFTFPSLRRCAYHQPHPCTSERRQLGVALRKAKIIIHTYSPSSHETRSQPNSRPPKSPPPYIFRIRCLDPSKPDFRPATIITNPPQTPQKII